MIGAIVALAFVLRFVSLNQSFWLDEAAQAQLSSQLATVDFSADFQPPFFYVFSWLWLQFGLTSEWFLRTPSVVFGVVAVYLTYIFLGKLFNKRVGLTSAFFLATAPYHIYYSQEMRMYSLLTLFVALQWILLSQKRYLWYAVVTVAALYTHYFALLALASQIFYVVWKRREEVGKTLTWSTISLIAFVPWLPTLAAQIQTAGNLVSVWPDWGQVGGVSFLKFPALLIAKTTVGVASPENNIIYGTVVILVALIFTITLLKLLQQQVQSWGLHVLSISSTSSETALLFSWFFVPVVLVWIFGLWVPASQPFRLLFVLPAFYGILTAGLLENTKQSKSIKSAFAFFFRLQRSTTDLAKFFLIILLLSNLAFSFSYLLQAKYHREDWRSAVAYTDSKVGESDLVLTESDKPWVPIHWYSRVPEKYVGASTSMQITPETIAAKLDKPIQECLTLQTSCSIYLYTYLFQLSDPNRLVQTYILSRGFHLARERDFRGVGIVKVFVKDDKT